MHQSRSNLKKRVVKFGEKKNALEQWRRSRTYIFFFHRFVAFDGFRDFFFFVDAIFLEVFREFLGGGHVTM